MSEEEKKRLQPKLMFACTKLKKDGIIDKREHSHLNKLLVHSDDAILSLGPLLLEPNWEPAFHAAIKALLESNPPPVDPKKKHLNLNLQNMPSTADEPRPSRASATKKKERSTTGLPVGFQKKDIDGGDDE